jgi:hypothetical protein
MQLASTNARSSTQGDTVATINYAVDNGTTPWRYNRPLTRRDPHSSKFSGAFDPVRVTVRNGRNKEFDLDRNAFCLATKETGLASRDFYDNPEKMIEDQYYKEMECLIQEQLGADKVVVYTHEIRHEGKTSLGIAEGEIQPYIRTAHVDVAPFWAEQLFRKTIRDYNLGDEYTKGRFVIVNAWRNISDQAIEQNPLAVCDEHSLVKPDDFVPSDYYNRECKHGSGRLFNLASRNADRHRWYYYPRMTKDEVLLFKQWDSDPEKEGRICFHSAFVDPSARADAPPRESIEVRAIAFFPSHEPNTCPSPSYPATMTPQKIVDKIDVVVESILFLPLVARLMLRWIFHTSHTDGEAIDCFVTHLLQDKSNQLGFGLGSTQQARSEAKAIMLKDDKFRSKVLASVGKLEKVIQNRRRRTPWLWWLSPYNW